MAPANESLGPELGDAVRDAVPDRLVPVVLAITGLGNVALLLVLFALEYWYRDGRRGAHATGAVGLIAALKNYFDAPRPPPEVDVPPISGHSFPSGDATTATIGWGLLAYDSTLGPRWARYGLAAVIAVLVALSRVVPGVRLPVVVAPGYLSVRRLPLPVVFVVNAALVGGILAAPPWFGWRGPRGRADPGPTATGDGGRTTDPRSSRRAPRASDRAP